MKSGKAGTIVARATSVVEGKNLVVLLPEWLAQRMGIGDGLVRLCAGIEAVDDIIADLDQALA